MEGFICAMIYSKKKKINESYLNMLEQKISKAYLEAVKQYLSSADNDLERFTQRYSGMRNALSPARYTMSRMLKRKISVDDVAGMMNLDVNSLDREERDVLEEEIQMAIDNPIETIGQDKFDELIKGFLHI